MTETLDIQQVADMLRKQVDEKEFIDVGLDFKEDSPISRDRFNMALSLLKEEGYKIHFMKVIQMGTTGKAVVHKVLAGPDATHEDTFVNRGNIHLAELQS